MLFRGLGPSMIRAFPLHAVIFVVYESTITFFAKRSAEIVLTRAEGNPSDAREFA